LHENVVADSVSAVAYQTELTLHEESHSGGH